MPNGNSGGRITDPLAKIEHTARLSSETVRDIGCIVGGVAGAGAYSYTGPGAVVAGAFGCALGGRAFEAADKIVSDPGPGYVKDIKDLFR